MSPILRERKLRTRRLRKSMGLVELEKHTGLSAATLSKLERGKLFPTLPTLLRCPISTFRVANKLNNLTPVYGAAQALFPAPRTYNDPRKLFLGL